jgi:hypothetical protein
MEKLDLSVVRQAVREAVRHYLILLQFQQPTIENLDPFVVREAVREAVRHSLLLLLLVNQ